MDYYIEHRHGHVEVRDSAGSFILSADTISEAMRELQDDCDGGCSDEKAG